MIYQCKVTKRNGDVTVHSAFEMTGMYWDSFEEEDTAGVTNLYSNTVRTSDQAKRMKAMHADRADKYKKVCGVCDDKFTSSVKNARYCTKDNGACQREGTRRKVRANAARRKGEQSDGKMEQRTADCILCDKTFKYEGKRLRVYCNDPCNSQMRRKPEAESIPRKCTLCGKDFKARPNQTNRQWCHNPCTYQLSLKLSRAPLEVPQVCQLCGKDFIATGHSRRTKKYCDDPCTAHIAHVQRNKEKYDAQRRDMSDM